MASSIAAVTDDSTTVSGEVGPTTLDTDIESNKNEEGGVDSPSLFEQGEKVLAFHSEQLYEAKILKAEFQVKEWKYFVHYRGWNKNWDEWVGIDRLMKYTEKNIQKQQELKKKQDVENPTAARGSQMKAKPSTGVKGRKRKSDVVQKDKGAPPPEKLVTIPIASQLKKKLIDDCEYVKHSGKLIKLPRSPNVHEILNQYRDYRLEKDGVIADSEGEILSGLQCYFDKALPAMLLYKSEREQYQEAIRDDVSPSSVYGAEHLLRLFVKLPDILFHASIEDETLTELRQKLQAFLRFLQKNRNTFFQTVYYSGAKKQDN